MNRLVLITSNNITEEMVSLLREFEKEIYNKAFPDNEREYFSDIIDRIITPENWGLETLIVLKIVNDKVVGGVVSDWYDNSKCLEVIYIALHPQYRGKGVGYELLWDSIKMFKDKIGKCNNIFIEVEKPHNRSLMEYEMNPQKRIDFWNRCGAKHIPIKYTQPPLSKDKEAIHNLMLMVIPTVKDGKIEVSKPILKEFLKDFYTGLKAENSVFLTNMLNEIDEIIDL